MHSKTYKAIEKDGEIVKGDPVWLSEESNWNSFPRSYFFNKEGQLIKMNVIDKENNIWNGIVSYNDGRITNIYWLKDDTLFTYLEYIYGKDNSIKQSFKDIITNELYGKFRYTVDKNGFLTTWEGFDKEKLVYWAELKRDDLGQIVSNIAKDGDGKTLSYSDDFIYNDKGFLESAFTKIRAGEEINQRDWKNEYQYDDYGNWIWMTNGKTITERTFEFFD